MVSISFGKFFDTQADHDLISSLELIQSSEIHYDDTIYLFKSRLTNDYYVILETDTDWAGVDEWTREVLSDKTVELEDVPPKSPDYPGPFWLYRVSYQ